MTLSLLDAKGQVEQAQRVLSVWMEAGLADEVTFDMMGALMTLLNGVADAIGEAEQEAAK